MESTSILQITRINLIPKENTSTFKKVLRTWDTNKHKEQSGKYCIINPFNPHIVIIDTFHIQRVLLNNNHVLTYSVKLRQSP